MQSDISRKELLVYPSRCTGCRACEAACSLLKYGECNPERSMIRVIKREWDGPRPIDVPIVCQHCEYPICSFVCPVNAINRDEKTGAMLINDEKCTKCELCIKACPINAIHLDGKEQKVVKCDLCGGEPVCAQWCDTKAITWGISEEPNSMKNIVNGANLLKMEYWKKSKKGV